MQISNKSLPILFIILLFNISCEINTNYNATGKSLEVILVQGNQLSNTSFNLFKESFFSIQKPLLETELYDEKKIIFLLFLYQKMILAQYLKLIKIL